MRMFDPRTWALATPGRRLMADGGRVGCPARGDADIESCFACGRMIRFTGGRRPSVVCGYLDDGFSTFLRRSG